MPEFTSHTNITQISHKYHTNITHSADEMIDSEMPISGSGGLEENWGGVARVGQGKGAVNGATMGGRATKTIARGREESKPFHSRWEKTVTITTIITITIINHY